MGPPEPAVKAAQTRGRAIQGSWSHTWLSLNEAGPTLEARLILAGEEWGLIVEEVVNNVCFQE